MIDQGKRSVIGVGVSVVDEEGAVSRVVAAAQAGEPLGVTALAVHGVVEAHRRPDVAWAVGQLDVVTPDGQPVRWALNQLHGARLQRRVYGPDLTLAALKRCADDGLPVYFYGSTQETLTGLVTRVESRFPGLKVAGAEPSRFRTIDADELTEIAVGIRASGARVLFVGLGCPRQEIFAAAVKDLVSMPVLAVGAAFDFHAGTLAQAPRWMQDRGLEWVFRLSREPKRLWRRYVLLNPYYAALVARQLWHGGRTPVAVVAPAAVPA